MDSLEKLAGAGFRHFVDEFSAACSEYIQGFSEYIEEMNEVIEIPQFKFVNQLVDVNPYLYEARDLLSIGYVHSAFFVLSRSIESLFRACAVKHHQLIGSPDIEKVKTFDQHIQLLTDCSYQGLNAPLIIPSMRPALDAVRKFRNMVVHGEELSEDFLSTLTPTLAKLCMDLLVRLERRFEELDASLRVTATSPFRV